ncbi:EAL domain-containing protein [Thiohalomonas denitrificans]|uniref:PAS domain S-box-containing protein/diguanylate cyclase (GGDEF) domain-containing protein n=1 Tax=Thiohalomonas denitrificans TaxID=415747 RepID=A0A1G5QHP8_9GAMM|nr:EAL domain-containing protein [Thiohalomonas denitrificans]SCZ61222.1 PAS domain S-box-containing protein/diguanylate cyclase (GGDEF) domain-containing protein [Thiohalomonas denitrificans]
MSEQNRARPISLETRIRSVSRQLADAEGGWVGKSGGVDPAEAISLLGLARKTLKASEDRYQRLVARAGAIVCEVQPDGTLLSLNDAVAKATGFRPAELIGQAWWDKLFPGEYRRGLWRLYRRLCRGDVEGWEIRVQSKHRTPVVIELSTANTYDGSHLKLISAFGIDVTAERVAQAEVDRIRADLQEKIWERTDALERINAELQIEIIEREQFEKALRTSEERFRRAVNNLPALVALYDAQLRIRFINTRALELWELSEREVIGSRDEELFPPSVTESYLPTLHRALRSRRPQFVEAHTDIRGQPFTFVFTYVPLLDNKGDIEELLGIAYDVTERRQIEEDLRIRHRELQTLNRISEIALTRRSLSAAYKDIALVLRETTEFSTVLIETYDAEHDRLVAQVVQGLELLQEERKPDHTARQVLRQRKIRVQHRQGGRGGVLGPELRTVLTVPMVVRESVVGLISVAALEEMAVDERQTQLMTVTANYIAVMTDRQRAEEALRESEAQRERAEQFSLIMVVRTGLDGRWLRTTPRLSEWLGYSPTELEKLRVQDVTHPEDLPQTEAAFQRLWNGEARSVEYEKRYVTKDGRTVWASVNISVVTDGDGKPLHFLAYIRDITEQKHTEEELRLAARVFESKAEAIMILDTEKCIVNVNGAFSEITGYRRGEVVGRSPRLLDSGRHSEEFFRHMWEHVEHHGQWQGELWGRRRNGQIFPALLNMGDVLDEQDRVINYVGIFRDITEIKQSQEQLERLANYDSLTRLPNRNLFYDRLKHGIDRARRVKKRVAILFVDLDNFKVINDTLGHDAGDDLLKKVADRLGQSIRSEDTVARVGGDEFIILLEEVEDIASVAETARRINSSLFMPMHLHGETVDITGSIGISVYPDDGEEIEVLLKNADTAMYVAKEEGRNNYRFFTGGMNQKAIERLSIESALRRALERDEFFLVYQPQIEVSTGAEIALEAAIRWNHPEQGVLRPNRFMPVAEASGLIDAVGDWVLHKVCQQIFIWTTTGAIRHRVAINLSPRQFRQPRIAEIIIAAIHEHGIQPNDLELELTETAVMQDPEATFRILYTLKEAGVHITIDDFGIGYSSLFYLKRFPIDKLKLDMSFVHDVVSDPDDAAISNAIIVMAHSLNIDVIAEGVETQEQLDFFVSHGCDGMQGFLFSPPLRVEQISKGG